MSLGKQPSAGEQPLSFWEDTMDLEELLFDVQDCVQRYRHGQLAALEAAIDAGQLLAIAREKCIRGDWLPWLEKVGLNRMTTNLWMRLARTGLTPLEVQKVGGIRAALEASTREALADSPDALQGIQQRVGTNKRKYYDSLTELGRAKRELAASSREEEG